MGAVDMAASHEGAVGGVKGCFSNIHKDACYPAEAWMAPSLYIQITILSCDPSVHDLLELTLSSSQAHSCGFRKQVLSKPHMCSDTDDRM